jgi:hypothetical protein
MNRIFLTRLALDGLAVSLLMIALAYWWLDNTVHEMVGTALFLLLILHNGFNRRWYGTIPRAVRAPRSLFNVGITFALALTMIALLVTSVMVSKALSSVMPAIGGLTVRQIHILAAYWALVIVAIHLGLRWPMLMGVARNLFGIRAASPARTIALRLMTAAIAIHGVWSSMQLGLGTKLSMQMSLDWWNFEESVAGFFIHCIAVAGLFIAVTYYAMKLLPQRAR